MAMDKRLKIGLIVVVVAIVAYLTYRWWLGRQSTIQSPTQSFGTNLNSVAPELVGGSAGPSVGSAPAVSLPVTVNITDPMNDRNADVGKDNSGGTDVIAAPRSFKPLHRQRMAAGVISGPDEEVPTPDSSAGDRGISGSEQDNIDMPDASQVAAPMYGIGGM